MDPRMRAQRLRFVGKLLKHVPSERIPELENVVHGLLPEEPEDPDAVARADEVLKILQADAKLAAMDPDGVKYKQ